MTIRLSRRAERLTSSLIRDILHLTQRPGVISFAGGLPAAEVMPPLDFEGLADDYRQYGPSEGERRRDEAPPAAELLVDAREILDDGVHGRVCLSSI